MAGIEGCRDSFLRGNQCVCGVTLWVMTDGWGHPEKPNRVSLSARRCSGQGAAQRAGDSRWGGSCPALGSTDGRWPGSLRLRDKALVRIFRGCFCFSMFVTNNSVISLFVSFINP